ncbi:MAG: hypothetical protein ABIQ51_13360 [Mesorhizobium sp.]
MAAKVIVVKLAGFIDPGEDKYLSEDKRLVMKSSVKAGADRLA